MKGEEVGEAGEMTYLEPAGNAIQQVQASLRSRYHTRNLRISTSAVFSLLWIAAHAIRHCLISMHIPIALMTFTHLVISDCRYDPED